MSSIAPFAGSVPDHYDTYLGPLLFEPYAEDMSGRLRQDRVRNILELACGTGRVTRHLIPLLPAEGQLLATDLNADMLALAMKLLPDPSIQWELVNAEELPYENGHFDHVVCQFGWMFFPHKEQAFRESRRVLKKGGKLLFNVWDSIEHNPRSALIQKVLNEMMGSEAPDLMDRGPYSFSDPELIASMVVKAGFEHVNIEVVSRTTYYQEAEELIRGFVDGSPLSSFLQARPLSFREELASRLKAGIEEQHGQLGRSIPLRAIVVEAIR